MNLYYIDTDVQFGDVPEYIWAHNYRHAEEIINTRFTCKILKIELIVKKSNIYEE